jgi:hypothetical protein
MFGGSALGGFALTDDDRQHGRYTLELLVAAVERAMAAGRFRTGDPQLVAHQMWIALHGHVTLDLGGYLVEPYDAGLCLDTQLRALMLGAGDDPDAVTTSLDRASAHRANL